MQSIVIGFCLFAPVPIGVASSLLAPQAASALTPGAAHGNVKPAVNGRSPGGAAQFTTVLPPRPFDSQWQLQRVGVLINNATMVSLGALLLALAVWFEPDNQRLLARWKAFRRWALAACKGFLLLIPL